MKKYYMLISACMLITTVLAQDRDSRAYNTGYSIGRILGIVLIIALVIWGASKLFGKK